MVQLLQRRTHLLLANRFQEVINAIDLERPQGIFIVGRRENHRTTDLHLLKQLKRRAIRQMNIDKDQLRHRMRSKPIQGIFHTV